MSYKILYDNILANITWLEESKEEIYMENGLQKSIFLWQVFRQRRVLVKYSRNINSLD